MDSSLITTLTPTSAVPSHPDTFIMDGCMEGLQHHFPNAKKLILADGVWDGIAHRKEQYAEYLNRIDRKYPNTQVIRFPYHTQQTAMAQYAIQNFLQTKLIFWDEHDAPLRTDREIDWDEILHYLQSGNADLIRLCYFEEGIHPEHEHLTRGRDGHFVRTVQFSGWCFLTTVKYFVEKIFTGQTIGKEMLELRMYGLVANAPWEQYKIAQYVPDGPAQRFRHSNGRGHGVIERDPCDWQGK